MRFPWRATNRDPVHLPRLGEPMHKVDIGDLQLSVRRDLESGLLWVYETDPAGDISGSTIGAVPIRESPRVVHDSLPEGHSVDVQAADGSEMTLEQGNGFWLAYGLTKAPINVTYGTIGAMSTEAIRSSTLRDS